MFVWFSVQRNCCRRFQVSWTFTKVSSPTITSKTNKHSKPITMQSLCNFTIHRYKKKKRSWSRNFQSRVVQRDTQFAWIGGKWLDDQRWAARIPKIAFKLILGTRIYHCSHLTFVLYHWQTDPFISPASFRYLLQQLLVHLASTHPAESVLLQREDAAWVHR